MIRRLIGPAAAVVCLCLGAYAYLYPGSRLLLEGSTTEVMSDDADASPLPYQYDALIRTFEAHPSYVFYGAVPVDAGNPEHPAAAWIPFGERAIVLTIRHFVPLEQMSTAVVFVLMVLTGLSFYALAAARGWRPSVAIGLGLAWAFCPFERARAKVHMAMVGTYHLPLIFLGLWLVARRRSAKSLAGAALCFLLAVTTIHYFIVTAAALTPLLLAYAWVERKNSAGLLFGRLAAAAAPAILLLGWSLTHVLPAAVSLGGEPALPRTGETAPGQRHPFLWTYAARPLDYLGGDVALGETMREWLWPRARVNAHVRETVGYGNTHERTNGIRYLILILAAAALITLRGRAWRTAIFFGVFAAASFWLSLDPDWPAEGFGASGWLQSVVAQVRVPSRAGIGVHFAMLMMSGLLLATAERRSRSRWRWLVIPGVLPLLIVLEYPPILNPMPTAPVRAVYSRLNDTGACGTGLLFPFVNDDVFPGIYYHFKQRLRGTGCTFVNAISRAPVASALTQTFPTSIEYVQHLDANLLVVDRVTDLARCAGLHWIAFDPVTPPGVRARVCGRLGWAMNEDLTCVAPGPLQTSRRLDDACL